MEISPYCMHQKRRKVRSLSKGVDVQSQGPKDQSQLQVHEQQVSTQAHVTTQQQLAVVQQTQTQQEDQAQVLQLVQVQIERDIPKDI